MNFLYTFLATHLICSLTWRWPILRDFSFLWQIVVIITFSLIAFFRHEIGNDYYQYLLIYNEFPNSSVSKEPIFEFLMFIFKSFGLGFEYFVLFFALLTIQNFFQIHRSSHWFISIFFISGYIFFAFDQIRQAYALSILLPVIFKRLTNQKVKFHFFYYLIAFGMHYSTILVILGIELFRALPLRPRRLIYLASVSVLFMYRDSVSLVNYIERIASLDLAAQFFNAERFFVVNDSFGVTLLLSNVTIGCVLVMHYSSSAWRLINFTLFWNVFYLLTYDNFILQRGTTLGFYMPILTCTYLYCINRSKLNFYIFGFILLTWLIFYLVTVYGELGKHGAFPLVLRGI